MYNTYKKRMTAAELLIVALVLATIGAITAPRLSHSATLSKQTQCNSNIELIQSAVELYSSQKGIFPKNIDAMVKDREFFPVGTPKCPLGGSYLIKSDHTVVCTHP